jgi:hypothetical protein
MQTKLEPRLEQELGLGDMAKIYHNIIHISDGMVVFYVSE